MEISLSKTVLNNSSNILTVTDRNKILMIMWSLRNGAKKAYLIQGQKKS